MKIKAIIWLILLTTVVRSYSAGPVIHLYLAQKFCQIVNITDDRFLQAFYRGTLLPDIRYLTTLTRYQTHSRASLDRVYLYAERALQNHDYYYAFAAGMIFHSYLDYLREGIVVKNKVYELLTSKGVPEQEMVTFVKLLEEELFFDKTDKGLTVIGLEESSPEELLFMQRHNQSLQVLDVWHKNVMRSLSCSISQLFAECAASNSTIYNYISPELQSIWNELFSRMLNDIEVIELVAKTITDVEHFLLIEQYKSKRGSIDEKEIYRWP